MKLNDDELELIHKGLNRIDYTGLGPTKSDELAELTLKIGKEIEKHDWVVNGKSGMYDTNYWCRKCHDQHSHSIDGGSELPEFGCTS